MIGTTISHYKILGQIGEGGMGVVYVAEDTRLGRRVALKIPHAGRDERHYHSRFLREARAVSKLTHPNIAAVYDYGETEDGAPFIVMELVTGQTLGDLLLGHGLTLARAVEVIEQVAVALAEAHRQEIVHRDVKPSNVIINDRGEVKVLDFGLAKQLGGGEGNGQHPSLAATRSDVVIGTPLYLSPEQARGSQVDGRSDLFALGALLYECVAGRPAFSGGNVIEIGAQVLHFDPPPPSQFNPRVPADLDRVTLKALAKRPEDRYQTAAEMAADLARVRARLGGEDTTRTRRLTTDAHLTRPSALNTITENLRRKRFSSLGVIVAAAVVALVGAAAYYFLLRPAPHRPNPKALDAYERGVDALREGAFLRASVLFREAADADKLFALANARLAESFIEMDYLERAMGELLAAQQVSERAALAKQDALHLDAVTSTVRRKYAEAVQAYKEIVRLNPDSPPAYLDLGRAHEKNNETREAILNYTEATRLDRNYAAAYLRLGALQARQRNVPAANDAFDHAEQLYRSRTNAEGEAEVHYQRGSFHVANNQMEEARRELTRARALAEGARNVYQQARALLQLSHTETGLEQSLDLVRRAVRLAEDNQMHDQAALGYIKLGSHYLSHNQYEEAGGNFRRALGYAKEHKVRRLEALAAFHLGSLLSKLNKPDEAVPLIKQSLEFYEQGGYRGEAQLAATLLGRTQRQQGDYAGALHTFEGMVERAELTHDPAQIAGARRECGMVLLYQDRYPDALRHLDDAYKTYKSLKQPPLIAYVQVNRANLLWRVGLYDESRAALEEAAQLAAAANPPNHDVLANALLVEAQSALSRRLFREAAAKAREARAAAVALGSQAESVVAEADFTSGLAEAALSSPARGRQLCEASLRLAGAVKDPWYAPNSRLALAEALLAEGDARRAHDEALAAREEFARMGRAESEWRALAVAGQAALLAGDAAESRDLIARSNALLSTLEQSWGAAAAPYLARPDVQQLRKGLGGDVAAAPR